MDLLKRLRARLDELNAQIRGINEAAETENRLTLTADEETRYGELRTEREQVEARIAQVEDEENRRATAAAANVATGAVADQHAHVTSEPTMYGRGRRNSYFLDLARFQVRQDGDALARLQRHAAELDVEMPKRAAAREARAQREMEGIVTREGRQFSDFFERSGIESRVNPNRTDGQGGYFVPPLWLVDEYVPLLRAGRTAANLVHGMDLPEGTDSINLPKVATGTATGWQVDNGAVQSTDLTDTFVTAPVRTVAGQQDVAMQLLDQSPIAFDEIVFKDLIEDYNQKLDTGVLYGSGSSGQVKGIANVSGINAVTYTDATPTVPEVYLPLAQALSMIARQRLMPATALLFTSIRWYWMLAALDSSNRPLVVPNGNTFNALGNANGDGTEGLVGNILGVNAYADNNIATNLGAGTNQDEVFAAKWDDLYLWEGSPRSRALTEVLSGTLQVRLQVYNYVGFMADRYPISSSTVNGTGLITPAGF